MAFKTYHIIAILFLGLIVFDACSAQRLRAGFYRRTCPQVEAIVKKSTQTIFSRAPTLAAPILRMHFHDCFVRGCDGSVLLNSTGNNPSEKEAVPNLSLRGFGSIDKVKAAVENKCPGVVSCADILALVARDAVSFLNGPSWKVLLGRRDGRESNSSEALSQYIPRLMSKCSPTDQTTLVEMDPGSFKTFDENYFSVVAKRRGLFTSDSALLSDTETRTYVRLHASSRKRSAFFNDFAVSMVKMGNIGVITGNAGEIRKHCAFVN